MDLIVIPRLGELLKEKNLTQTQLSEMTGIPQGTISKFDKNKQHQDIHLFLIANALKITINDLFYVIDVSNGIHAKLAKAITEYVISNYSYEYLQKLKETVESLSKNK